jgi:MFS family permease
MPLTFADIVANPRAERKFLWLIATMNFTNIVDFMVMMPLSAYLMRDFGISTAQFGVLVSAYALAAAASSLLLTSIADRYDRKTALLVCYTGLIAGTIGCAVAPNYSTLLLARIVAGFFGGVQGSITMAMVGDTIPDARRGRAMSLVMLAFSFSAVMWPGTRRGVRRLLGSPLHACCCGLSRAGRCRQCARTSAKANRPGFCAHTLRYSSIAIIFGR